MAKSALIAVLIGCFLLEGKTMPADTMSAVSTDDPPGEVTDMATAMYYMKYFNDMDQSGTEDDMQNSLKDFQRIANLPITGKLDKETLDMMNADRCGVRNNMGMTTGERTRAKRYDAVRRWPEDTITWRLNSGSPDLARNDIRTIMRRALTIWSDVADITFVEDNSGQAVDFDIEFYPNGAVHTQQGDGSRFDGQGRVLAHAFFPTGSALPSVSGDAHFDDDELFTEGTSNGINLFQVAAHEFGHSLGLGHSTIEDALMAAFYRGYVPGFVLHSDDIAGIQFLYGANSGRPEVTMPPIQPVETDKPGEPVDPANCPGFNLDAVVTTSTDGENFRTFLLKGEFVWENFVDSVSKPMRIGEVFNNLPSDVDAGLYLQPYLNPETGRTYFFKGAEVYTYRGTEYESGPDPISEKFIGLPNNLDSAFVWSGNGRPYFTKGDQYYRYNPYRLTVDDGYPRSLSVWGLTDGNGDPLQKVDAALQYSNFRTYFFSGDEYVRYDDGAFGVDQNANPPYPRNVGQWWFGCISSADLSSDAMATVFPSVVVLAFSTFLALTVKL